MHTQHVFACRHSAPRPQRHAMKFLACKMGEVRSLIEERSGYPHYEMFDPFCEVVNGRRDWYVSAY